MATTTFTSSHPTTIATDRLLWAGALTAVLAVTTSLVIYFIAESVIDLSGFSLLNPASIIVSVGLAAVIATIIYGQLGRYTSQPVETFNTISKIGLVVSFLPIVGLLLGVLPGEESLVITAGTVVTLAIIHVTAAATIVGMLTTIARQASWEHTDFPS